MLVVGLPFRCGDGRRPPSSARQRQWLKRRRLGRSRAWLHCGLVRRWREGGAEPGVLAAGAGAGLCGASVLVLRQDLSLDCLR